MANLDTLLRCESEEEFLEKLESLSNSWSAAYLDYFSKHIKPEIMAYSGRWILERNGVYNPYSGVTTNISEGFNNIIKWVNDHKKLPVDNMVLSLFYLQNAAYCEVLRGRANLGNFTLKEEFRFAEIEPSNLKFPHKVIKPDEVLESVNRRLETVSNTIEFNEIGDLASDLIMESRHDICPETVSESSVENPDDHFNTTSNFEKDKVKKSGLEKFVNRDVMAEELVMGGGVKHIPEMECFIVKGSDDKKYAVTLYPKESCQCPSTTTCYHILAAKNSIGIKHQDDKKERKLVSLLRYKSRPRSQKKIGQKKPKPTDFETVPAPDSKIALENNDYNSPLIDKKTNVSPLPPISEENDFSPLPPISDEKRVTNKKRSNFADEITDKKLCNTKDKTVANKSKKSASKMLTPLIKTSSKESPKIKKALY